MMRQFFVTVAMVVFGAEAPIARAEPSNSVPAWCGKTHANYRHVPVAELEKETDPRAALKGIVFDLCFDREDSAAVAKIQTAWSQKLNLTDADWNDVADWDDSYVGGDVEPSDVRSDSKLAWTKFSAIDQFAALTNSYETDSPYLADAFGPRLTESGRLGFLWWCLRESNVVTWAACQDDIDALDLSKLGAELDGDHTHSAADRIQVRVIAGQVALLLPKHKQAIDDLFQKDPAYKKLFDLAHTARASWKPTQAFIDLLSSTEAATITNSRRASAGCEDKTWAAWQAAVAEIPAKEYESIFARDKDAFGTNRELELAAKVVGTPDGFLAAAAFVQCQGATRPENIDGLADSLSHVLHHWPGSRGPRTEAITEILQAGIEFDDRNAKLYAPGVARLFDVKSPPYAGPDVNVGGDGGVAKVVKKGDSVTIAFAPVKHTGDVCVKSHTTNRIERIDDRGNFVYEVRCDVAKTVTRSWPPSEPVIAVARYATDVAPGVIVSIRGGIVDDVFKKGAKVPSAVLGVHVK